MTQKMRIALAQQNFFVGDTRANLEKILLNIQRARDELHANLVVFPELALTGYPCEDLLLRPDFLAQVDSSLKMLEQNTIGIDVICGYPHHVNGKTYNAAAYIRDKKIIGSYHKQCLPNYGVFDEKRYFTAGETPFIFKMKGINLGLVICEDLWSTGPIAKLAEVGAQCIICINASPFDVHKLKEREKILRARIKETHFPIIYVHCVGGQDEIIFDGRSMVFNEQSERCLLAPAFKEVLIPVDLYIEDQTQTITIPKQTIFPTLSPVAKTYHALELGLHDYLYKNGFKGALVGLSGGIDSALTLCIAADALGPENVQAVLMPSRYTSQISNEDALTLTHHLGVSHRIISIESMLEAFLTSLAPEFRDKNPDVTEENIQARCRATILMALSNKFGKLVLTTGNKSEMAIGYATLYGDMAGGFAVLKDVYKTLVYELAHYRNHISLVIPRRMIERPPSAELAYGQTDQDTLPPYSILDPIIEYYVEQDKSPEQIIALGFEAATVYKVIKLIDRNEYKRRQAPPGVKITTRAFGRDRRYPITSGFSKWLP